MNEGLSAGDILALTKNNENGMWDNPFIYLVWLAVLGGGNGLFGNRGDAAVQGAITRSDLFEGFNNQDVNGQLRGITNGLADGFYAINSGLKDVSMELRVHWQKIASLLKNAAAKPIATLMQFAMKAHRTPAQSPTPFTLKAKQPAH